MTGFVVALQDVQYFARLFSLTSQRGGNSGDINLRPGSQSKIIHYFL